MRTEELTLPGFLHDTYSTAHPLLLAGPAFAELGPELAERGLCYVNTDIPTAVSLPDGRTSVLSTSFEANIAEAERLAPGDGAALAQLMEEFGGVAEPVFQLFGMDLASSDAAALIERVMLRPGGAGYSECAQTFAQTARDLLEQRFRSPVLRAMLAPWALHLGRGPEEATSGLWIILVLAALGQAGMPIPDRRQRAAGSGADAALDRPGWRRALRLPGRTDRGRRRPRRRRPGRRWGDDPGRPGGDRLGQNGASLRASEPSPEPASSTEGVSRQLSRGSGRRHGRDSDRMETSRPGSGRLA